MRFSFRGKTYKHRCPDGSVKIIHRNLDDAFPLYVPGMAAKIGGDVGALLGAPGSNVGGEYQSQLQGLLYSLSDRNESLMMSFRAIYAAYQTDPCANQGTFDRQLEAIVEGVQRLTELQVKVRGLAMLAQSEGTDKQELMKLFHELVSQVGGPLIVNATAREIEEARDDAQRWIGPKGTG